MQFSSNDCGGKNANSPKDGDLDAELINEQVKKISSHVTTGDHESSPIIYKLHYFFLQLHFMYLNNRNNNACEYFVLYTTMI